MFESESKNLKKEKNLTLSKMEARDLRKGNFVKNDKLDILKKGYIVLEAIDIYNLSAFENGQTVDEEYKYFEPIKISKEFLSKTNILSHWVKKSYRGEYASFSINGFLFYYFSDNNTVEFHGILRSIKFIHELQNLYFALTGEELSFSM